MVFTKEESKTVLECIRFDITQKSVGLLTESSDIQLITADPVLMLESYFSDVNTLLEDNADASAKKAIQGILTLVKSMVAIGATIGLGTALKAVMANAVTAKGILFNMAAKYAGYVGKRTFEKGLAKAAAQKSIWGKLYTAGQAGSKAATSAKAAFTSVASNHTLIGIAKLLAAFKQGFLQIAVGKLGISFATANAMVPFALAAATIAGLIIIYKLCKILVAGLKKMVALFKSGKKEEIEKTSENLASASIKMQEQAISKIEDPKKKQMVIEQLNKKKAKLKK